MIKRLFFKQTAIFGIVALCFSADAYIPRTNLFSPFDCLVRVPRRPGALFDITAMAECAIHERGYQADEDDQGFSHSFRKRGNVLQLYQDTQDLIAALKGNTHTSAIGHMAQKYHWDDDNGTFGLFIPDGKFRVDSFSLGASLYGSHGLSLSVYVPFARMELKDVTWKPAPNNTNHSFDSQLTDNLIEDIEKVSNVRLRGWKRQGLGDVAAIVSWEKYFHQHHQLLDYVGLNVRTGLIFPTGKKAHERYIGALPFGHDGGVGFLGGFSLDLWYHDYFRLGGDVELLYLCGSTKKRYVKTDIAQTDMAFLTNVHAFRDPGFLQHFTLWLQPGAVCGVSARVAYQYTKQQDDKLYLKSDRLSGAIANSAERVQDWTTHSAVFSLAYDAYAVDECVRWRPYINLQAKHGFNGQRAILFDTVSCTLGIDF